LIEFDAGRRVDMKKILVAHDGSKASEKAVKQAFELARKFNAGLIVISVIPELYLTELVEMDRLRILDALTTDARKTLERIKSRATGVRAVKTLIKYGNPASEILDAITREKVDLVVTGSHGRHGAQKFLLGSVSSKVVDHAACSVLVVK
jgi:nucleotide-binding universal stress UspA family protein